MIYTEYTGKCPFSYPPFSLRIFIDFPEVFGKSKRKDTSLSINAIDPYPPAIGLQNGLDNRQPESWAFGVSSDSIKRVE